MAVVLVPLAQGCEELEAVTIIDLLRRAQITVVTAGLDDKPVHASRGVTLIPDTTLEAALKREYDMIVLPGGMPGADHLDRDARLRAALKATSERGRFVAAICAAPKALASAGLLDHKRATAYPGIMDNLTAPGLTKTSEAVVCDGVVITSRGPGTAMDFALMLIEKLAGRTKRDEVEHALSR
ncbi:MAG TPA: DJ-1 family glyoxalase III [Gammaproteobacteria bacterium]|nr:DJ-1 family glyoxalase III [Gammaproteobacteria bacterium]